MDYNNQEQLNIKQADIDTLNERIVVLNAEVDRLNKVKDSIPDKTEEVKALDEKIDALTKEVANLQITASEYTDTVVKVGLLNDRVEILNTEINRLEGIKKNYTDWTKDLAELESKIEGGHEELLSLGKEKEELEGKIAQANSEFEKQAKENAGKILFDTDILRINREQIANLMEEYAALVTRFTQKNTDVKSLETQLETLTSSVTAKNEELRQAEQSLAIALAEKESTVREQQTAVNELEGKRSTLTEEIKVLDEKKSTISVDIDVAEERLKSAEEARPKILEEINKKEKEFQEFMDSEKSLLEVREGDMSKREKWLEEKTDELKNIKAELEKFYNRPININF